MKKIFAVLALALPLLLSSCLKDEVYGGATISNIKNTVAYTGTTPVTVTATVSSLVAVKEVNLIYSAGSASAQTLSMAGSGDKYTATIPAQPLNTEVSYYIEAKTATATATSPTVKYVVGATPINYSGLILNELNGNDKFIELYNKGTETIPLEGVYIAKDVEDNITWTCDARDIAPGQYLLLYSEDVCVSGGAQEGYEEALIFHSGLSAKKAVRIILFSPASAVIDDFNLKDCKKVAPASYSRNADGKWYHADATPGAVNVEGTEEVEGLVAGDVPEEPEQPEEPDQPEEPAVTAYKVYINEISCGEKKIEIYNSESKDVDIAGYVFTKDGTDTWTVPAGMGNIPAGGFVVYNAKQADPSTGPMFGISGTKGFTLELAAGETVVDAIDNKTEITVIEDTETFGRKADGGATWVIFSEGTIGASNAGGTVKNAGEAPEVKVFINEISCGDKKIEIFNAGESDVDIAGYVFTKDGSDTWEVPAGMGNIPTGGFVVYTAKQSDPANGPTFGISGTKGFDLVLANADGEEMDHIDNKTAVTVVEDSETYGRKTDGADEWVLFSEGTIGASNAGGTVKAEPQGVIILNELNGNDKFIELYNCGEAAIDLTGYRIQKDGTDVWTGSQKVEAGAFLLLYSEDVVVEGGAQEGYDEALVFHSGLSAKKNVKVEILDAEGASVEAFNLTAIAKTAPASYSKNADGKWYHAEATPGAANAEGTELVEGLE